MLDQDWVYAVAILVGTITWLQIFFDYRKKLLRMMPSMQSAANRKEEFNTRISESEMNTQEILETVEDMRKEIALLDEERIELQEQVNKQEMILIPAGKFKMGSSQAGLEEEHPEHIVHLRSYYIDPYEVTNIQYKDFVDATGHRDPSHWRSRTFPDAQKAHHPVVGVSWEDARAYAEWSGKRLPTEAEWERAARGEQGHEYSWSKVCSPDHANYENAEGKTTAVSKYPSGRSDFGVWDMCGNVGEWVNDWYSPGYYSISPESDPPGPERGHQKVVRGGGYQGFRMDIRATARNFSMPSSYQDYMGFRCVMDVED